MKVDECKRLLEGIWMEMGLISPNNYYGGKFLFYGSYSTGGYRHLCNQISQGYHT
jgi:hypothetical protein